MNTKCRHCGSTSYGSGCIHSPTRKHEHRDDEKHCEWCGSRSKDWVRGAFEMLKVAVANPNLCGGYNREFYFYA